MWGVRALICFAREAQINVDLLFIYPMVFYVAGMTNDLLCWPISMFDSLFRQQG